MKSLDTVAVLVALVGTKARVAGCGAVSTGASTAILFANRLAFVINTLCVSVVVLLLLVTLYTPVVCVSVVIVLIYTVCVESESLSVSSSSFS